MRIAFYLYSMAGGGAERVVATLASYWAQSGRDVLIVTEVAPDSDFYPLHESVRRVALWAGVGRAAGSGLLANVRRALRLRNLIRRERLDVAIAMMNTANVVMALAGVGLRGVTLIGSERAYPPAVPLGRGWSLLRYWCYGWLHAVVVQTDGVADWVSRNTRARKAAVIPNPVQLPLPDRGRQVSPSSVGRAGTRRLLAVGRLEVQKGFDVLLEAFGRASAAHDDWILIIMGEGSRRAELEKTIVELGLPGKVFLVGSVGNVGEWYASSDLFVLSSRFEGFPNALLEALAHGLPAVSFDCETGPRDLLRNGWNGVLVEAGQVAALELALLRMMSDDEFRHSCAINAQQTAERYCVARIAALWDDATRR